MDVPLIWFCICISSPTHLVGIHIFLRIQSNKLLFGSQRRPIIYIKGKRIGLQAENNFHQISLPILPYIYIVKVYKENQREKAFLVVWLYPGREPSSRLHKYGCWKKKKKKELPLPPPPSQKQAADFQTLLGSHPSLLFPRSSMTSWQQRWSPEPLRASISALISLRATLLLTVLVCAEKLEL